MKLQIDSTVIYGRGNAADRQLSTADLQLKSPYNTYYADGLPPTPIGAVSDASLRAALAPANTELPLLRARGQRRASRVLEHRPAVATRRRGGPGPGPPVITGATRVAGVIGDPVRHSLSPRLHNAAYRALGLDWVYVAFEVPDGGAVAALDAARVLDLIGLSVTMPHKTAIAAACDELTPDAAALHSVNTVTRLAGGRTLGDSTDGTGFLRSLADAGVDAAGRPVLLLGAGGAARARWRARSAPPARA